MNFKLLKVSFEIIKTYYGCGSINMRMEVVSLFVQSGLQVVFLCCLLDKVIHHYSDLTDLIGYILS